MKQCIYLLLEMPILQIRYVFRESNMVVEELASIGHEKKNIIFIFIFAINKISIEELQNLHYTAAPKEGD